MPKKDKAVPESHSKGNAILSDNVTQKPNVRKLIGGNSWTGKLPVNILSEHCQKNRWEKPEYSMVLDLCSEVSNTIALMLIECSLAPRRKWIHLSYMSKTEEA